jgi:hypothetical protein
MEWMRIRRLVASAWLALASFGLPIHGLAQTTERVSVDTAGQQADSNSSAPSISADGRFVAFVSFAANLVPDDTNLSSDVLVRDRITGTTERVSVDSSGQQGESVSEFPSISADGRFVAFHSFAANLVPDDTNRSGDVFVRDRIAGITERVSVDSVGREVDAGGVLPSIARMVASSRSAPPPRIWYRVTRTLANRSTPTSEAMCS